MPIGELASRRFRSQLLTGDRPVDSEAVAKHLLAIQAQDPRGARLAIRARSEVAHAAAVDEAISSRRLVVSWLNRGTLHMVHASDFWWLHELTTPQLSAAISSRLGKEGLEPAEIDRGVDAIVSSLAAHGPMGRVELREIVTREGIHSPGQGLVHLLALATIRHYLIRARVGDRDDYFVRAEDWIASRPESLDRPDALALLARRYLHGHGPAAAEDLAKWAGIRLTDARAGLAAIERDTVGLADGLIDLPDREMSHNPPNPVLLGPFDPVLHGWRSRDFVLGHYLDIVTTNGTFRPFAMVQGRAVATWRIRAGTLILHPLEPIAPSHMTDLNVDAERVLQYLGLPPKPVVIA